MQPTGRNSASFLLTDSPKYDTTLGAGALPAPRLLDRLMLTQTCTPVDLAAFLVTTKLTVPTRLYARLLVQVTMGDAWAVYAVSDPSSPLAVAGIFAWPDRESEAWFMVDGPRASKSLPQCLLALRRILRAEAPRHVRGILARVEPGNRGGETIARALGFGPSGAGLWRIGSLNSSAAFSEEARRKSC